MNIAVIGTGYVGLVTGTCLAETGNHVVCIDIDREKVKMLESGVIPIFEPGLENLFKRNTKQGRLSFTTDLEQGIEGARIIFLALPTPPGEDGSADLQYIIKVASDLGPLLKEYTVIVDKSTVPVGTADKVREVIQAHSKVPFDVVSNPEFLREGVAVEDFMKPERIVIGTNSAEARELMSKMYEPLVRQGNPVIFMDEKSAELTKYAANSFLATKISFMNEIANLCDILGADVDMVRKGMGTDSRIGKRFLFPGIGYGGSCFPKDVSALAFTSNASGYEFKILEAVLKVNEEQRKRLLPVLLSYLKDPEKATIAVWGLAFKPYTDDIREAPSLYNIEELLNKGFKVRVFDPEAMSNVKKIFGDRVYYAEDEYDALESSDALFIATEWPIFRTPDFDRMEKLLNRKLIFDGRNLYDPKEMEKLGYSYISIGRRKIK